MSEPKYDEYGGIIIEFDASTKTENLIQDLEDMSDFILPSSVNKKKETDKDEPKQGKKGKKNKMTFSTENDEELFNDDWLDVISNLASPKSKKSKKGFKGFNIGKYIDGDESKDKKKKNKEGKIDHSKQFDNELALLRNMSKDQSVFVDDLQKLFNQLNNTRSQHKGVSKFTTDMVSAISSARDTNRNLIKDIATIKKNISDLNFRERKEFGKNDNGGNVDNADYASTFLKQMVNSGRKNYLDFPITENIGSVENDISVDVNSLFDHLQSVAVEGNNTDDFIKYENAEVKHTVEINDDGTYSMEAYTKDGEHIPSYPKPQGLEFRYDLENRLATDQFGRKYELLIK